MSSSKLHGGNNKRRASAADYDTSTSKKICLRWEEVAIERVLDEAGLMQNRRGIAKVVYCFWKLGPGWHSSAALSQIYSAEWPWTQRADKKTDYAVRQDIVRLNNEVNLTGRGSLPNHDSECTRRIAHGVCRKPGGLLRLEPRLRTILQQACDPRYQPVPPRNDSQLVAKMWVASRKECERLRLERDAIYHQLQCERVKFENLETEVESLRKSEAAIALASLQQSA